MFGELDESQRRAGGRSDVTDVFMSRPAHRLLGAPAGRRSQLQKAFWEVPPSDELPRPHHLSWESYGKAGIWDAGCAQAGRDGASLSGC